jgi:hypothetical protein
MILTGKTLRIRKFNWFLNMNLIKLKSWHFLIHPYYSTVNSLKTAKILPALNSDEDVMIEEWRKLRIQMSKKMQSGKNHG